MQTSDVADADRWVGGAYRGLPQEGPQWGWAAGASRGLTRRQETQDTPQTGRQDARWVGVHLTSNMQSLPKTLYQDPLIWEKRFNIFAKKTRAHCLFEMPRLQIKVKLFFTESWRGSGPFFITKCLIFWGEDFCKKNTLILMVTVIFLCLL